MSGLGNGGPDDNDAQAGRLIVAPTLREHPRPGSNDDGAIIVTHALTAEGHDASEDGTGRGTPIVAVALNAKPGTRHDPSQETLIVAAPLTSGSHPNSNAAGRRKEDDENLVYSITLASDPISAENLARPSTKRNGDPGVVAYALRKDPGGTGQGHNTNYVADAAVVRRLTPTECERLQGFPDGWTAPASLGGPGRYLPTFLRRPWPNRHDRKRGTKLATLAAALHSGWRHMHGVADSVRYAALGDAVTTTVPEWVGARMAAIDERDGI